MARPAAYSLNSSRAASICSSVVAWISSIGGKRNRRQDCSRLLSLKSFTVCLRGERRTTATAAGRVRVLESETGTHNTGDVIDLNSVEVLGAEHIDKHPDTLFIDHEIAVARLFFNIQTVLKTRKSTGHDAYAKSRRFGQSFFVRHKFLNLPCR